MTGRYNGQSQNSQAGLKCILFNMCYLFCVIDRYSIYTIFLYLFNSNNI